MVYIRNFQSTLLGAALAATIAAAGVVGVAPAWAGAGTITTVVTPLSTNITYSIEGTPTVTALPTWVGYTVSISNAGGNTVNAVRFIGKTSVTDSLESAVYSSIEGTTACTASGPDVDCQLGQLRAGEGVSFAVFFKAPAKVANGVADANGQDSVSFSGTTKYAEGDGGPNSPPQNSIRPWAANAVGLGTENSLVVKSAVQKTGGVFFTGAGGVSKGGDKFATTVTVPPSAKYTTAAIEELIFTAGCVSFVDCYRSTITVPLPVGTAAFSPYLTFVLRQDQANIVKGTRIETVVIKYTDDASVVHTLGACATGPVPRSDGVPCIAQTKYYKNSRVTGWTLELDGDFEWTLINLHNGSFDLF